MLKNLVIALAILLVVFALGAPLALAQTGDPTNGSQIYADNCLVCHGPYAKGRVGVNLSQDFPSIDIDAFLQQTIADGVEGTRMPAWAQSNGGPLTDQQIADVAAYVVGLSGGSEPVAPAPTPVIIAITPATGVSGAVAAGAILYAENCAVCHGTHGQGRVGAVLQQDWPALNPAVYVRSVVEGGVDGTLMPAWLDANGGPLTAAQIDNISSFVVSLPQPKPPIFSTEPFSSAGFVSFEAGMITLAIVVLLLGVVVVIYYRRA